MKWFEPLIAIGAIILVIAPIITHFVKKKKGTLRCECGHLRSQCVGSCSKCEEASKLVSKYHNNHRDNNKFVYELNVSGMKCGMCEEHINNAVRRTFNDVKVKSSRHKKLVSITSSHVLDMKEIMNTISSLGYKVEGIKLK